jgi:hypothetical protein
VDPVREMTTGYDEVDASDEDAWGLTGRE